MAMSFKGARTGTSVIGVLMMSPLSLLVVQTVMVSSSDGGGGLLVKSDRGISDRVVNLIPLLFSKLCNMLLISSVVLEFLGLFPEFIHAILAWLTNLLNLAKAKFLPHAWLQVPSTTPFVCAFSFVSSSQVGKGMASG